jgi:beta-N-acetylglucosaminidase
VVYYCYARYAGWDSQDKAIIGGGEWIFENWINKGQDTLYSMKWDIDYFKVYGNVVNSHQYATSIRDAYNKGSRFAEGLISCDAPLTFRIPVFENMPVIG